ncbi:signal peptidase I [Planomonospora sp. ID82291]|uniref:signal peptidase I n=1 Tax=Planomonospora sp. ID82291 TaxID=2738136 RepID=UPI0018C3BA0F|nr:signal peptidase I [Planomonospora sp. ID82291]MBG0812881.1 signal peptidase I [Planomonospora sp. ID82291]
MTVEPDDKQNEVPEDEGGPGAGDGRDERSGGGRSRSSRKSSLRETLVLLTSGVVVALLLQAFVFQSFWIPSESMENTLVEGDRVVVNKLHGATERGDVVVFKGWDGEDTIKRVIAVGGDTVKCCDARKRITVNGVPIEEKAYLHPDDLPSGDAFEKVIPKGRLWVMGDHRSQSRDARSWEEQTGDGTISEDDVVGRAFAIYWPFSRAAILSTPETFARTFTEGG